MVGALGESFWNDKFFKGEDWMNGPMVRLLRVHVDIAQKFPQLATLHAEAAKIADVLHQPWSWNDLGNFVEASKGVLLAIELLRADSLPLHGNNGKEYTKYLGDARRLAPTTLDLLNMIETYDVNSGADALKHNSDGLEHELEAHKYSKERWYDNSIDVRALAQERWYDNPIPIQANYSILDTGGTIAGSILATGDRAELYAASNALWPQLERIVHACEVDFDAVTYSQWVRKYQEREDYVPEFVRQWALHGREYVRHWSEYQ